MAALLVRAFSKQCTKQISTDIIRIHRNGYHKHNLFARVCVECHGYHTTAVYFKKKKEAKTAYRFKERVKLPVIKVWQNMTVRELSESSGRSIDDVLEAISYTDPRKYYGNSIISYFPLICDVVKKLGATHHKVSKTDENTKEDSAHSDAVKRPPPDPSITVKRHPVVTVMGHVDHGKTTLLDSLRKTSVAAGEFGGITQHIGAFNVTLDSGERITFLDTPGHAAFSAMRSRGAHATDIVILVVAADDGVMAQTVQSIQMAQEAKVPIIVAINKIDKPQADIKRTQRMLSEQGIHVEALGGEVQCVNISALQGTNLNELMETVATQAELMDLRGDPTGFVEGVVIEGTTEVGRGKLATALIQRGTLRKGSILVSGLAWAKVRAMFDHAGNPISEAKLSEAVQIIGWRELPMAGDEILEVENERRVNMVLRYREMKQAKMKALESLEVIKQKQEEHDRVYKEELEKRKAMGAMRKKPKFCPRPKLYVDDGKPRLNVIIKGDVLGSVEAILDIFDSYGDEERCELNVVHYGVGPVTEHDIEIAEVFNAIIYTFHVDILKSVGSVAEKSRIGVRHFKVIYKLIDDLKEEIQKLLPCDKIEEQIGKANVLQWFQINEKNKKVSVAGCRCTDGILKKKELYRIMRGEEIIFDGKLMEMKHLKTDVNSIKKDVECGLRFEDPTIIVQPGDTIICYTRKDMTPTVKWDPGF